MDEFVCITALSRPGESQEAFKTRLSELWSGMLREAPDDFEKVYAETTKFEPEGDRWTRQYLAEESVISIVEARFAAAGVDHQPVDMHDVFNKYEAVSPDWMQIEH